MKLILFLLCFSAAVSGAVSTLRPVHHHYHAVLAKVTWTDAQSHCREMYSDLATIVSNNDWMRLKKEVASKNLTSAAWTGLYNDINSWRWSLNDLKNITVQKWHSRQPDNYGGNQSCGIIDSGGYWYDECCTDTKPFICYSASNSGADRFIGVASPQMTWSGAQIYCRTFHTDLASALSQTDNDLLAHMASLQGDSWIGLFRDTWKWSDGTNPTKLQWDSGEPDNDYNEENCGAVYNGDFTDQLCNNLYYFICHIIPPVRKQQIVRLQVKSDGIEFDPDVHSSILELIKQKVEEKGMLEDSTLTWRVQRDGDIFYKKSKNVL
ncbi:putative C-type lectin domain family 20 member A [Pangasianodon hypophthalmus]|uniref:putative C-type lectin domain family 20 member A n=1 Tax=Pangasianodon hypophthalmus TaxID=310915 RepID=UPI0023074468|nr:putative C-type lectin domain family 20 member A [Pangasianodon hypophthalmus]